MQSNAWFGEVQMQLLADSSLTAGPAGDAGGYEKAGIQFTAHDNRADDETLCTKP